MKRALYSIIFFATLLGSSLAPTANAFSGEFHFSEWTNRMPKEALNCRIVLYGNIDGDKDLDLICIQLSHDSTVSMVSTIEWNNDSSWSNRQVYKWYQGAADKLKCDKFHLIDVDGNGTDELICRETPKADGPWSLWATHIMQLDQAIDQTVWFAWNTSNPFYGYTNISLHTPNRNACYFEAVGFINDDAYPDLICLVNISKYSDAGNIASHETRTMVSIGNGRGFDPWRSGTGIQSQKEFDLSRCQTLLTGDVNADGRSDLICPYMSDDGKKTKTFVQISNGSGFESWQSSGTLWDAPHSTNGGDPDFSKCQPLALTNLYTPPNEFHNSALLCAYDNGIGVDGHISTSTWVQMDEPSGHFPAGWGLNTENNFTNQFAIGGCEPLLAADVNSDGAIDLVCPYTYNAGTITWVQLSSTDRMAPWKKGIAPSAPPHDPLHLRGPSKDCGPITAHDVNGDGWVDLVCPSLTSDIHVAKLTAMYVQLAVPEVTTSSDTTACSENTGCSCPNDWDCDGIDDSDDWGVVLTFDMHPLFSNETVDMWDATTARPSILDTLEAYGARATFFVSGFTAAKESGWPELLNKILAKNHQVGWHGRTHKNAKTWMESDTAAGLEDSAQVFVKDQIEDEYANYVEIFVDPPSGLPSAYAYPDTNANDDVDSVLKDNPGISRVRGTPSLSVLVPTTEISSRFRLAGQWMDNWATCEPPSVIPITEVVNGVEREVTKVVDGERVTVTKNVYSNCKGSKLIDLINQIRDAHDDNKIIVLNGHNLIGAGKAPKEHDLLTTETLRAVLEEICILSGGTTDLGRCTKPDNSYGAGSVYHRFKDLPAYSSP